MPHELHQHKKTRNNNSDLPTNFVFKFVKVIITKYSVIISYLLQRGLSNIIGALCCEIFWGVANTRNLFQQVSAPSTRCKKQSRRCCCLSSAIVHQSISTAHRGKSYHFWFIATCLISRLQVDHQHVSKVTRRPFHS